MPTQDFQLYPAASDVVFAEKFTNATSVGVNGGTISGNPVIKNGVGVFDGAGDKIQYGDNVFKSINDKFTVSFRTNANSQNSGAFFDTWNATGNKRGIRAITGQTTLEAKLQVAVSDNGEYTGHAIEDISTDDVFDGDWHHIVIVFDGSQAVTADKIKMYKDGVELSKTSITANAITSVYNPTEPLKIGALSSGATLAASVKDMKSTYTAWTAQEVLDDYNNSTYNYRNKAVLNLPMHDKIGAAAPFITSDVSGQGNDATLGDGSTASTFPTKLTHRNGYEFDGSTDYLNAGNIGTIKSVSFVIAPDNITQSILDCDGGSHKITVSSGTVSATGFSSPSIYVNGLLNGTLLSNQKNTVTVSTATGFSASAFIFGKEGANYYDGKAYYIMANPNEMTLTQHKDMYFKGSKYLGNL